MNREAFWAIMTTSRYMTVSYTHLDSINTEEGAKALVDGYLQRDIPVGAVDVYKRQVASGTEVRYTRQLSRAFRPY